MLRLKSEGRQLAYQLELCQFIFLFRVLTLSVDHYQLVWSGLYVIRKLIEFTNGVGLEVMVVISCH